MAKNSVWPLLFVLALGLGAAVPDLALAQGDVPETRWMKYDKALEAAEEKQTAILMYFPAEQQLVDLPVFRKKDVATLSHEMPFVKILYESHQPLRQLFGVDVESTLVVTDWWGNALQKMPLRPPLKKYDPKQVIQMIRGAPVLMKKIDGKLEKSLARVPKAIKKKKYAEALKAIQSVLRYKGYPATARAEELEKELFAVGEEQVSEALAYAKKSKKRALEKLEKLAEAFFDTPIEDMALDAIVEVEAME